MEENNIEEAPRKIFEEILDENMILKKEIESLKHIGNTFKAEMEEMKAKLAGYEVEKMKRKFCIHCKNEYNPLKNENVKFYKEISL